MVCSGGFGWLEASARGEGAWGLRSAAQHSSGAAGAAMDDGEEQREREEELDGDDGGQRAALLLLLAASADSAAAEGELGWSLVLVVKERGAAIRKGASYSGQPCLAGATWKGGASTFPDLCTEYYLYKLVTAMYRAAAGQRHAR